MIRAFKGRRRPRPGDQVKAYRRLSGPDHQTIKWSLKDPQTGLVIGHADEALMTDVTFTVSEAGRQRVIATGQRNVHAYAVGTVIEFPDDLILFDTVVHYDPYQAGYFYDDTGQSVPGVAIAHLDPNGRMYA